MEIGDLPSESSSGVCLLLSIPEDVFTVITRFLSPSDICNLSLCCKSLCELVDSEKIWLVQCEVVKVLPLVEVVQWRSGISSYKALCRFLVEVMKPLVGVWVHQNPELGNVVYVMPGFLSVVGCRIVPQEVGPLGIQEGRVMWSSVFEIICCFDGSAEFFLYGKDRECSFLYPGFVTCIEKSCNVFLLEVEPRGEKKLCGENEGLLLGKNEVRFLFCKLAFSDRRKLLETVTSHVGLHGPGLSSGTLFSKSKDDKAVLMEHRTMLLKMHKFGGNWKNMNLEDDELCYNSIQVDINEIWKSLGYGSDVHDENQIQGTQSKSFSKYFKSGINHILRRSSSSTSKNTSSSSEIRRSNLQSFLSSGDSVGLSVRASKIKFSSYRGWPNMPENHFALYKLPIKNVVPSEEYAGLWGGTFGWPPGKCTEEKPGKALFLLMLTYEQSQENNERHLIGTKILEGTHYVMHPNGSAMFVVKIDSPSFELFPLDTNGEDEFEHSYTGEGIAKGYGFRYPGYKPGSLFVTSKGLLMFVWKETRVVLTLQRLDLEELLKKGICVPPLAPCLNFAYLTKSHTNVFAPGRRTP